MAMVEHPEAWRKPCPAGDREAAGDDAVSRADVGRADQYAGLSRAFVSVEYWCQR